MEKLSWLNGQWMRELSVEEFAAGAAEVGVEPEYLMQIAPLVQGGWKRSARLHRWPVLLRRWREPDAALFAHKNSPADQVRQVMQLILWKLEALRQWEKDAITGCIQAVVEPWS